MKLQLRLVLSILIATLVFSIGILLGSVIFNEKVSDLDTLQEKIKLDSIALDTELELAVEDQCSLIGIESIGEKLSEIGPKLARLSKSPQGGEQLDILQKYYSVLEIKHWLVVKDAKQRCSTNHVAILYFYSNIDCFACGEMWSALSKIKEDYPYVMVYSFDSDLDFSTTTLLKKLKNVTEAPTIVIGNQAYPGLYSVKDIEVMANLTSNKLINNAIIPNNATKS